MQLIYDRLVVHGISRFIVLDPMHDVEAMRRSAAMVRRAGAPEMMGALTFTLSPVHDDAFYAGIARVIGEDPNFDRAHRKARGLEIPPLSSNTTAQLKSFLPPKAIITNPIDTSSEFTVEQYHEALHLLLDDENVDIVIVIFIPP